MMSRSEAIWWEYCEVEGFCYQNLYFLLHETFPKDKHAIRNLRNKGKKKREKIQSRDKHTCQFCGLNRWLFLKLYPGSAPTYNVDHLIPIALGGTSADSNLVLSCTTCNNLKGATPYDDRDLNIVFLRRRLHNVVRGVYEQPWYKLIL